MFMKKKEKKVVGVLKKMKIIVYQLGTKEIYPI